MDTLNDQVEMVKSFADENFLKLNVQKCEIVVFDRAKRKLPSLNCEVGRCCALW